jgi:peptide/nickel transport system permease protein/oligopeptide transport system permease protein
MGRYVIRRLLQFIPTAFFALFLLHYMTSVGIQLTGNPARALFGERTPPPALLEQLTRRLGLDDPCLDRAFDPCIGLFGDRLVGYANGDFGTDLRLRPVVDILGGALPYTLRLAFIAFVFEACVGVAAGVLAGLRSGSFWDYFVKISTVFTISVPIFVLGVFVRTFAGVKLNLWVKTQDWAPEFLTGIFTPAYRPEHPWGSLVLPGLVLGALSLATTARLTRTSLIENLRSDYVRTARAKGLDTKRVVGVHTLRNSLIPVVTSLGVDIGTLMGGAVVTESVFNVPGIGRQAAQAARNSEASVVIGIVTILVMVYLIVNLLVDLLYAVLDPRIRYE